MSKQAKIYTISVVQKILKKQIDANNVKWQGRVEKLEKERDQYIRQTEKLGIEKQQAVDELKVIQQKAIEEKKVLEIEANKFKKLYKIAEDDRNKLHDVAIETLQECNKEKEMCDDRKSGNIEEVLICYDNYATLIEVRLELLTGRLNKCFKHIPELSDLEWEDIIIRSNKNKHVSIDPVRVKNFTTKLEMYCNMKEKATDDLADKIVHKTFTMMKALMEDDGETQELIIKKDKSIYQEDIFVQEETVYTPPRTPLVIRESDVDDFNPTRAIKIEILDDSDDETIAAIIADEEEGGRERQKIAFDKFEKTREDRVMYVPPGDL